MHRQHRFDARVGAGERGGPLVSGPVLEPGGEQRAQLRPVLRVVAGGHAGQAETGQQSGVELRLQGTDGHPLPVRRLVDVVPGHAAVEQVHSPLIAPALLGHQHQRHSEQRRRPVHDGRVDYLAPSGRGPLDQGRADAVGQEHAAAAEVPEQVGRELRRPAGPAQAVQGPGPGDVPDVVPGRGSHRPVLSPPGHPGVYESRIAGQADVRSDTEALGHARPEALEQHIGGVGEPEQRVDGARLLQVQDGGLAASVHQVTFGPAGRGSGTVDPQHGRALVGEHHGAERPGPDTRELEHAQAGQRPRPCCHVVATSVFGVVSPAASSAWRRRQLGAIVSLAPSSAWRHRQLGAVVRCRGGPARRACGPAAAPGHPTTATAATR